MEATNHNRRKTKVVVGLEDNRSIFFGGQQYGQGKQNDQGFARASLKTMLFSDPVYMGLVHKKFRTAENF